jgi:single-strand DNA-binding protein
MAIFGRGTVNKVILIGRLGGDPELKYTPGGTAVATFSMATNMYWKDQEGNQQEKTEWHRIVTWRKTAEFVGEWFKKGGLVYVEGRLQTRSWDDKDGIKRYTTEVVADNVDFIGGKRDGREAGPVQPPTPTELPETSEEGTPPADDLPF